MHENLTLLTKNYRTRQAPQSPDGRSWSDGTGLSLHRPELAWIHVSKFSPGLLTELVEIGLAELGRPGDLDMIHHGAASAWIGLHPALGGAYMSALSRAIGESLHLQPMTDQPDFRIASPSLDVAAATSLLVGHPPAEASDVADQPSENEYVMLAFECVVPRNLAEIPAEKIILIRENLAEELQQFRAYVDTLKGDLMQIAALPVGQRKIDAYADHIRDTIEIPLRDLERGLKLNKVDTFRSLITTESIAPPAALGVLLNQAGATNQMVTSAGAAVAIGTAWWQARRLSADARNRSPVSYLLDVHRELTPDSALKRARRLLRRAR